jgi:hypothetical protein
VYSIVIIFLPQIYMAKGTGPRKEKKKQKVKKDKKK